MNDILLVDDEQAVLQNLSAALDWSEYGFSHIHMANSAKEALSIMERKLIDLIILDIQMPEMTGLEMLKNIRTRYPDTHCILISAYSKFEYAKEALQLNVENYLLKPIDIIELHETVTRAAENIMRAASSSHNLFERNLLDRWLHGRIASDELLEHSQYTHYNVLMRRYYAVIVRLAGHAATVLHSLASSLSHDFAAYSLNVDNDTGILLFGGHDISDIYIEEAARLIVTVNPGILIICGSCAMGSNDVCKSFSDANSALEYAKLTGYSGYISFNQINWHLLAPAQLTQLNDMLQLTPSESQIRSFIQQITDQTNMNPTYIGRLFREELGMYFSEYVSNLRINKAKLLLESTTYSVSDIARQVGIYDVSYFVQCFKKKERVSPMKYRQSVAQSPSKFLY